MFGLTLMLCDAANVVDGKLTISGGGWLLAPTSARSQTLAIVVQSPPQYSGRAITIRMALTNDFGDPTTLFTSEGVSPLSMENTFTLPETMHDQVPITTPITVTLGHLDLAPDQIYHWAVTIDQAPTQRWITSFYVYDDSLICPSP